MFKTCNCVTLCLELYGLVAEKGFVESFIIVLKFDPKKKLNLTDYESLEYIHVNLYNF